MVERQASRAVLAWHRLPLLALGGLALITGMWGGLLRLGWGLPVPSPALISDHGALMVCGFLGTLIGLERAVALGRLWAYMAPLLTGFGIVVVFSPAPGMLGVSAVVVGSLVFVVASIMVVLRQPASYTVTMALGAVGWATGNVLWCVGQPIFELVLWWEMFLLLTIAGERLELSRLVPRGKWAGPAFVGACALFVLGVAAATWWRDVGTRAAGLGVIAVALWLGRHDLARRTVRDTGLTRYVAVCLLSSYVWLLVSGVLLLAYGPLSTGLEYDAALHAFFIGFVFSMIFGHAPIIFPAVLGIAIRYRPAFYVPLALLHASLIARVVGDLGAVAELRMCGGLLNAVAILLLIGTMASSVSSSPVLPGGS